MLQLKQSNSPLTLYLPNEQVMREKDVLEQDTEASIITFDDSGCGKRKRDYNCCEESSAL